MKIYVTKHFLVKGIIEYDYAEISENGKVAFVVLQYGKCPAKFYNNEWHVTKYEAIKRAKEIKSSAIRSCKLKLERLNKIKI